MRRFYTILLIFLSLMYWLPLAIGQEVADEVRPDVSLSVPEGAQNSAFDVVITFTEVVSGFAQADLTVSGTANASITAWTTTDNTVFTATITPTTSGAVTLSVAADVATDAASNNNTAAETQTVTIDMDAPSVSLSVPEDVQTDAFDVTITFSEAVSDFLQAVLTVSGTATASITAWETTDNTVFTATITPTTSGDVTLSVAADVATDAAGNNNTASDSQTVTVTVEPETEWMPDENLRNIVRGVLGLGEDEILTKTMVRNLTSLNGNYGAIEKIKGLEHATSLTALRLSGNSISDVSALSKLTSLTQLDLPDNSISDVSHLKDLTSLTRLYLDFNLVSDVSHLKDLTNLTLLLLHENSVSDVSGLSKLTNLNYLALRGNSISDVSPLEDLTNLILLWLKGNPISDTSPLYDLLSANGGTITYIDIDVAQYAPWDVNEDGDVDASDSALVTAAIGQSGDGILNSRTDVNGDGTVDNKDLTLVTDNLDANDDAAAPLAMAGIVSLLDRATLESLDPEVITAQLSILRAKSDGSLKYQRAIALLESMLVALRPVETLLLANYPNPFNPETWLPYHLADASDVVITIYDMRGTVVRRLELGHQREGYYTSRARAAYWDGRNHIGERVASGIYFYQLEADDMSLLRKMVILK